MVTMEPIRSTSPPQRHLILTRGSIPDDPRIQTS